MAAPDLEAQAHEFIDRLEALLEEVHALGQQLERPRPNESASAEAERILYFTLVSAVEAGLIRTMEDVLSVLRQASEPLGPMGAEWMDRQDRALKRDDE
jgi:hypothetical protein